MGRLKRFEDMEVWVAARSLVEEIYNASRNPPFFGDYALRGQICRAVISIASNIAEGFESQSNPSFVHFLASASGSAAEVRAQLYLALDLGFMHCLKKSPQR